MPLQAAGQGDGIFYSQLRPRADGEVGGMGGIAGQHGLTAVPALVGDRTEVQPRSVRAVRKLPDELMPVQMAREDLLQDGQARVWRHGVETQARVRLSRAFNDKCAGLGVDSVRVSPHPTALGRHEGKRERLEYLVRPQPDVPVTAQLDIGLEALGFQTCPAVHSVACDYEIRLRQLRRPFHVVIELDLHPGILRPAGQDVQQVLPADAIAPEAGIPHLRATYVHDLAVPVERRFLDLAC
jgi:hypothetical protein